MEQFVFVPAFVYNKSLNAQSDTNQELPIQSINFNKIQPTKVIHKKQIIRNFFATAESLVDNTLFCPRIKFSNLKTLNLDGIEVGM